jgi:hypothetical protein
MTDLKTGSEVIYGGLMATVLTVDESENLVKIAWLDVDGNMEFKEWVRLQDVIPASIQETRDNVNSPSHYQFPGGVEVIQITKHLNFCRGNAVKYLARAGRKDIADELEDLKKAAFYVQCEIDRINAERAV